MVKPLPRLKLQGFNNLTKSLSFNIYDLCYALSDEQRTRHTDNSRKAYTTARPTPTLRGKDRSAVLLKFGR